MRTPRASTLLAVALLWGVAGCGPAAERCRPDTLLVAVTLAPAVSGADTLRVTLSIDDVPGAPSSLPHVAGQATGNVVVEFPHGYPHGHTIGIDVQALLGGVVIGAAQGSQPLAGACEATPLTVEASGASHDLGGDTGADLASAADLALPAVDLAPPADLAVALDMTCVPTAEAGDACFDGVDNDCDGQIDCADSDCGAGAQCVPVISSAFTLGIAVGQASFCPALYTSRSLLDSGLTGGSCPTTGCSCSGVESCSVETMSYDGAGCSSGATEDVSATAICRNFSVDQPSQGVSVPAIISDAGGQCNAVGTSSPPGPQWGTQDRFCQTTARGGGCASGKMCVPRLSVQTCEVADGAVACDSGYTPSGGPWYTGYSDNRSCSCACGAATGGKCGTSVAYYTSSNCSGAAALTLLATSTACGKPATPFASLKIVNGTTPSCGAATASVSGALTGSGPQTLCCLP